MGLFDSDGYSFDAPEVPTDNPFESMYGDDPGAYNPSTYQPIAAPEDSLVENLFEKLNPFELLALPSHAVAEGIGAYRSGEGLGGAAAAAGLGLFRGTDEALYPTTGKQFLPEELDEGFGRKLARFGVDVVSDPLVLFGGPIFKGAAKLASPLVRGAMSAPAAQRIARFVLPTEAIASKWGGRAGQAAVGKARRAMESAEIELGKYLKNYEDTLNALRLGGRSNAARRELAMDAIEEGVVGRSGGVYQLLGSTGDDAVDQLALQTARMLDDVGARFEGFIDKFGDKFKVSRIVGDGKGGFKKMAEDFARLDNYVPQVMKREVAAGMALGTKKGFSQAVSRMVDAAGGPENLPYSQAEELLKLYAKGPRKAGNIEWARSVRMPKELLERDPARLIPQYLTESLNRMSFADEFGIKGKGLYSLMDRMREAGLQDDVATEIGDLIRGAPKYSRSGLDAATQKATAFQVLSKMGPLSTISNLSQNANTVVTEGASSFLKGLGRAVADPNAKAGAIAFNRGLKDSMEQILGASQGDRGVGWLAGKWLDFWQFNRVEKVNRLLAANAGIATAERMMSKLPAGQISSALKKRGASPALREAFDLLGGRLPTRADDMEALTQAFLPKAAAQVGAERAPAMAADLADEAIDGVYRLALRASNKTQHATKYLDLPPAWRSPEMKVLTQYKSFIHQQTKFLMREIFEPAARGDYAPLVRAAAAFGVAGPAVASIRDTYRRKATKLFTGEEPEGREFDWDDPLGQILSDMLYVGAFGMVGDLASQALRGDVESFLLGPTLSDAIDIGERGARGAYKMAFEGAEGPSFEDMAGFLYRFGPGRRALGAYPGEFIEALPNQPERFFDAAEGIGRLFEGRP